TDSTLSLTPGVIGSYVVSLMVADDDGAIGTDTRTIDVFKLSTATTVVSSSTNSTSVSGENVTFTATVTVDGPGSAAAFYPTGTVTFYDNGTAIGTGTLSTTAGVTAAALTTNLLSTASHAIAAAYTSGDANFNPSPASAPISQRVNQAAITVSVTSSVNPSVAGQGVAFLASVSASILGRTAVARPTGTVTPAAGHRPFGPRTLNTAGRVSGAR